MRKTMTAATTCLTLLCTLPQHGICFDPSALKKLASAFHLTSDKSDKKDQGKNQGV